MTRAQMKDQLLGLAWGVGVAVIVAIAAALAQSDAEDIFKTSFWVATGAVAVRSAGTAVLTFFGIKLPGISGGREE